MCDACVCVRSWSCRSVEVVILVRAHGYRGPRLTSSVFVNGSPPYILEQGPSLNPKLSHSGYSSQSACSGAPSFTTCVHWNLRWVSMLPRYTHRFWSCHTLCSSYLCGKKSTDCLYRRLVPSTHLTWLIGTWNSSSRVIQHLWPPQTPAFTSVCMWAHTHII